MRIRRLLIPLAAAATALAVAAPGALGAWAKVSGDDVSPIDQAPLAVSGGRVVAAWPSGVNSELATSIAFRGWAPTPAASFAGAGPIATATGGYSSVSQRPGLFVDTAGGLHVVTGGAIAGQRRTYLTPALTEGAPGGALTELAEELIGPIDALQLAGGGVQYVNMTNGEVRTYRDAGTDPLKVTKLQERLGGPAGYHPALGQDGAGRLWVAWYSNASGNIGIFLLQLDPATGLPPVGAVALKVPQSESPANNGFHLALACSPLPSGTCRIVYGAQANPTAPLRLASWSPGEAAPTEVATRENLSLGLPLTAEYRADGRLWVAWWDRGTTKTYYAAKLGNAKGAGGTVQNLGLPAGKAWVSALNLDSVVLGTDLVIATTTATTATRGSLWTNYVQDPSQIIANPQTIKNGPATVVAPKRFSLKTLKRTKCVRVRVTVSQPARVLVAIYSGRKSIRLFGQKIVVFRTPATKVTCIRVPLRAKTFNVRTPLRFAVAVRKGATKRAGEPPARVVNKPFRFF